MWASERLGAHHILDDFHCGNDSLDSWLKKSATHSDRADNSRTFVWSDGNRVVAYFALCPHVILRETLPSKLSSGGHATIPCILLAKLALQSELQGRKLGSQLLVDALTRAVRAVDEVGGRFIIVDAVDDNARSFYEHFGFENDAQLLGRMLMRSSDAKASLAG